MGSFINVLVFRLPIDQSIIFPGSQCPKCHTKILFFDNLPILIWFFLRGKCRFCKKNISFAYPLVELITALLVMANINAKPTIYDDLSEFGILFAGIVLTSILITLAALDFKYFWLPNFLTVGGTFLGIIISIIFDFSNDIFQFTCSIYSISASLIGYLFFYFVSHIGLQIFKKPVMGGGDAKLSSLIGSWLGIKGLFISIWLAFQMAGLFVLIGLILRKIKRNQKVPFGVFLASSTLLVWYFGNDQIIRFIHFS